MTIQGEGHIFTRFDNEMKQLHGIVVEMGSLSIKQLNDALETLRNEDTEKAYDVINNDAKLNQLDVEADELITTIIAKRAPVAKDLRELIAVGKIVSELERAGDEARKIAGLTIRFFEGSSRPPNEEILGDIYSLAEYVSRMLAHSMETFDDLDVEGALEVLKMGLKLDDRLQTILRHLSTFIHGGLTKRGAFRRYRTRHPGLGAFRRSRQEHRRSPGVHQVRYRCPPRREPTPSSGRSRVSERGRVVALRSSSQAS